MVGGNARGKALLVPAAWLRLCKEHHEILPSKPNLELLTRLLAIKRYEDYEHFDRVAVCRLASPNHPHPEKMITHGEVQAAYEALYGKEPELGVGVSATVDGFRPRSPSKAGVLLSRIP